MNRAQDLRTEKLLAELAGRYDLRSRFVAKLRPIARQILHGKLDEERRIQLLELLAETCDRDLRIRREANKAQEAVEQFFDRLRQMLQFLAERRRRPEADAEGPGPLGRGSGGNRGS
ncbi:MAG: hypothetical protein R3F30_00225 [Planctomycetota bacterium]